LGLQQGALAPSSMSILSSWLSLVGYRRGYARWLVALVGFIFVVGHFVIAYSRFRRVPSLGGVVKCVVVRMSHGEVRSLMNIPFDAILYYRFDAHDRVHFSNTVLWIGLKEKEKLHTYQARSYCLPSVLALSILCSFQVERRGFRVGAQGKDVCKWGCALLLRCQDRNIARRE
jgi:hypothetical protein